MRPTTEVCARFESKGKPRFNKDTSGSVQDVMRQLIPWMLEAHMGTAIKITFARTPQELAIACGESRSAEQSAEDLMAEMMAQISQHEMGLDSHPDA